ncbi:MAG: hypothetical protein K8T26_18410 [Lentisphaerae bacterium]|nr:hypothetical protein [Lentisphaerota bacterium]
MTSMTQWRGLGCACGVVAMLATHATGGYAVDVRLLDRTAAKPATYRTRLLLDSRAFSVDTTALRGRPSSLLCRQEDAVYLVDRKAHNYLAFNLQALTGTSSAMRKAGELLAPGLGDFLPAGAAGGACEVQLTDRRRDIAGLPCQLYVVTRDGERIQEIWATPWSQVHAPPQAMELVKSVAAAWSTLAAALSAAGNTVPEIPLDGFMQIDGYPVLFSHFTRGRPLYEARLGAPQPVKTTAADFTVPSTYTRSLALPASGNP